MLSEKSHLGYRRFHQKMMEVTASWMGVGEQVDPEVTGRLIDRDTDSAVLF